jgi:hypothetical protein
VGVLDEYLSLVEITNDVVDDLEVVLDGQPDGPSGEDDALAFHDPPR